MADRLYTFPAPDAPISEWLKPVSGRMRNERQHSSTSSAQPAQSTRISGKHLTNRVRQHSGRMKNDPTIVRMAAAGATASDIAEATGMKASGVRRAASRLGVVLQTGRGADG